MSFLQHLFSLLQTMWRRNTAAGEGPSKKKLIILGGGYAGMTFFYRFENLSGIHDKFDITLVDKKEYFECNLASPGFLVDPQLFNGMARKFATYSEKTRFVCGEVTVVTPHEVTVTTHDGTVLTLAFDFLVIALGTHYPLFKPDTRTIAERAQEIGSFAQRLRDAQHVLVVGGRGVGVEMIGEIVEAYPGKKMTVVHSGTALMDTWPASGIEKLRNFLAEKPNLHVILNNRIMSSDGNIHRLADGTIIEADLKIMTSGMIPNTKAFEAHFSNSLTNRGYIKTRPSLQLEGHDNVFAFGDIAEGVWNKTAILAREQGYKIIANILAMTRSKPITSFTFWDGLKDYPTGVTVGQSYVFMALPIFGGICFYSSMLAKAAHKKFKQIVHTPR